MSEKIFIIGNGFDIANSLPTKYSDFMKFIMNINEFEKVYKKVLNDITVDLNKDKYKEVLIGNKFINIEEVNESNINKFAIFAA